MKMKKKQKKSSPTFEELSEKYPGMFIDGNKEAKKEGIGGFTLPGDSRQLLKKETEIVKTSDGESIEEASEADWIMFELGEKALDRAVQKHIRRQEKEKKKSTKK